MRHDIVVKGASAYLEQARVAAEAQERIRQVLDELGPSLFPGIAPREDPERQSESA